MRSTWWAFAISTLSLGAALTAQITPMPVGQARDAGSPQQAERQIPIGTSSISGTVVALDTGRPVSGARVSVSGQVTANSSVQLPAARGRSGITVQVISGLSRTVVTDSSGQFSFPRLPAGLFTIAVFQSQFLQTNYGQRRPGGQGTQIPLVDGQQLTLKVPMARGAAITGLVIGPDGEPQRNAQVRGWRIDMSSGYRRLQSAGFAQTDDRGIYRMFGLQPGDYFVSATPNPSDLFNAVSNGASSPTDLIERAIASAPVRPPSAPGLTPMVSVPIPTPPPPGSAQIVSPSYLPTYAPNSMAPSGAAMVTVAANEERAGMDIRVQLTQASNIQGAVATPLDPGVTVQVSLLSDDQTIDAPQANSTRPDNNGTFIFRAVTPGNYTVLAQTVAMPAPMTFVNGQPVQPQQPQPVLTDAQKMWGKTQVTVAGESTIPVSVSLQPARSISGMLAFDMAKPPDLSRSHFSVTIGPAPSAQSMFMGAQQAPVGPDGRFTVTGVAPGRYIIRVSGGQLKSSVVDGQDTLDFPLEFTGERDVTDAVLTLTDQSSELSGTLTDSSGKPGVDYMVIAVASDSRYWAPGSRRIAMARPTPDGRYTIRALPAGSYQLAAVVDLEPGQQYDPEFLRTVARASVPVTIADSGKVTQDIRVK